MRDDDAIIAALSRLEAEVSRFGGELSRVGVELSRMDAEQVRLRTQLNDKMDTILDGMSALREDSHATKGHVLYVMQENLTLSQRITKLEDEMRRR